MGNGYQFAFVADAKFGLNLRAQFVDLDLKHLAQRDDLSFMLKKLEYVARNSDLLLSGTPQKVSENQDGAYFRVKYVIKGSSSYENFVRFVNGLHEERVPCAFEDFKLVAQSRDKCSLEATLLFTTLW
jgi:hypothetical protein